MPNFAIIKTLISYCVSDGWISARPAVTPDQQLPNRHSEVGCDRRARRPVFFYRSSQVNA